MKIWLNGATKEFSSEPTLMCVLAELKVNPDRVAVTVNDCVIPKARREACVIRDGDRVEVLAFAGGG
jgi:thiamine biosynthesis protein ThiS